MYTIPREIPHKFSMPPFRHNRCDTKEAFQIRNEAKINSGELVAAFVPGQCVCKEGFMGTVCDQCDGTLNDILLIGTIRNPCNIMQFYTNDKNNIHFNIRNIRMTYVYLESQLGCSFGFRTHLFDGLR
jgi:hypothetical protein